MSSPTQRTLKWLRDQDVVSQVVEKWCPHSKRRIDLFGFIDIVSMFKDGLVGIQATSDSGRSSRVKKILLEPRSKLWLASNCAIWVVTWGLKGKRGERKRWTPHVTVITSEMYD